MVITRMYQISVKTNYYYEKLAKNNIERKYYIKPVRGEILDRNGKLLAVNDIGFSIAIAPNLKNRGEELNDTITAIVKEFPDFNATKLLKQYIKKNSPYNHRFIKVIDFISYKDMIGAYPKLRLMSL